MKIGIAVGTASIQRSIERTLACQPEYQVLWTAQNAEDAVALCATSAPDLLLLDLSIPWMGGVEATRRIMASVPCAILVMAGDVGANASQVFDAMGHGALDAIDLPKPGAKAPAVGKVNAQLLAKINGIERVIRQRKPALGGHSSREPGAPLAAATQLVVIGASAGGPAAIASVLRALPKDFPAAIVVVQHVDARFAASMAAWLAQQAALSVRLAGEGDRLLTGSVYLPNGEDHLVLKTPHRLGYIAEPRDSIYRPSIDVLFQHVSRHWQGRAAGVLLTGMGRDGADGLKALRDRGHYTVAQDSATSVVYGMPKAAAELDAAVDVVPLELIASKLIAAFSQPV